NRALLESMVKTQFTVNKVLGIECLSPNVNGNPKWEWSGLIENIRDDVSAVMEKFFPNESEIEDE
ncbi:relaxosome protein TraM, partial [Klebsiella pneumoniae]|uniref:relaxosome protein TraM n=1 Tax=Klebsiella pneumoniae TaxID=573 RepID=UPI00272FEDA6